MIFMLIMEVYLMTSTSPDGSSSLPTWLFPQNTGYELIWLLHTLFPAFMNGCRSLGAYLYIDLDEKTRQLLLALQEQNKDILLVLRDVQIHVQNFSRSGPVATAGSSATAPSTASTSLKATPTGKLKELQDRLYTNHSSVASAVQSLDRNSNSNSSSSMGFYAMILGYIVISYIFN